MGCLLHMPQPGTQPETWARALTWNQTRDLSVWPGLASFLLSKFEPQISSPGHQGKLRSPESQGLLAWSHTAADKTE